MKQFVNQKITPIFMHFTLLQKLLCCADYIFRKAGGKYPFLDKGVKIYPQKNDNKKKKLFPS